MCDLCGHNPCLKRCPNAADEIPITYCEICGSEIYEYDDYYNILGSDICEACVEESKILGD